MTFFLEPHGGWSAFEHHQAMQKLIWNALTLRGKGGTWAYHNLSMGSSIWDCQKTGSHLSLFTTPEPNGTIEELGVQDCGASELAALLCLLDSKYGLKRVNV